jgi:hypothetical protein
MEKEELNLNQIDFLIELYFFNLSKFTFTQLAHSLNFSKGHPYIYTLAHILLKEKILKLEEVIGLCKFYSINKPKLKEFILSQNKLSKWIQIMPAKFDFIN